LFKKTRSSSFNSFVSQLKTKESNKLSLKYKQALLVANDARHRHLIHNLRDLRARERTRLLLAAEEKAVAILPGVEALGEDAGGGRAHHAVGHRQLAHQPREQVDVARLVVELGELDLDGGGHARQVGEVAGGRAVQAAPHAQLAVGGQAVVAAALHVGGAQTVPLVAARHALQHWRTFSIENFVK